MRYLDSNLESFRCRKFKAGEALGFGAMDGKDALKIAEYDLDLSFSVKIDEAGIVSARGGSASCFEERCMHP